MKKRITSVVFDKINTGEVGTLPTGVPPVRANNNINALGDFRDIDIYGNPGAVFSFEITNAAGYSILETPLKYVTIGTRGVYSFTQIYPRVAYSDTYTITITPLHNTELTNGVVNVYYQQQYINPIATFTYTTTDPYGGSGSYSGSDVTISGLPQKEVRNMTGINYSFGRATHTVTATHSSALLYTIPTSFSRDYSSSKDVTKTIKIPTTNSKVLQIHPNTNDLVVGMSFKTSNSFEKTLNKSIPDASIVRDIDLLPKFVVTDKFGINNTNSLMVGMIVSGNGVASGTTLASIEDTQSITLSKKQNILNGTTLTFKKDISGTVKSIDDFYQISLNNNVNIPGGSTVTFNNNKESFNVITNVSGSGTATITITNSVEVIKFGKESASYTQDIDNFITLTPNAYSQWLETTKATATNSGTITINVLKPDKDSNVATKTPIQEGQDLPKHGTLAVGSWAAGVGTCTYTPNKGFTGDDVFYFYVDDANDVLSARTPIYITVI